MFLRKKAESEYFSSVKCIFINSLASAQQLLEHIQIVVLICLYYICA